MENNIYAMFALMALFFFGCNIKNRFVQEDGVDISWEQCIYEDIASEHPDYKIIIKNNTNKTLVFPYSYYGQNYKARGDAFVKSFDFNAYVHPPGTIYITYKLDTMFFQIHTTIEEIKASTTSTFYLYFCGIGKKSGYSQKLLDILATKGTMYLDYIPKYFKKTPMGYKLIPPQKIGLSAFQI